VKLGQGLRLCIWRFSRDGVILKQVRGDVSSEKGTTMPTAVKIKAGKYGSAIRLLLERGGAFQTRHERTLIVNAAQKKALEAADLIETNGLKEGSGKDHGHKKDAG
jgi:hypothetical protein